MREIVFSYGCPRSGTTAMQHVLKGGAFAYEKIREFDGLHPCNSPTGLVHLAQLFRNWRCVFVRTVRDPVQIFESFHAARLPGTTNPGVAANTDERIFRWILDERRNTEYQKKWTSPHWDLTIVEADYDELFTDDGKQRLDVELSKYVDLQGIDLGIWGGDPVREGRMSHGVTESLLSDAFKEEIRTRCAS